jgi:hypothetical protein
MIREYKQRSRFERFWRALMEKIRLAFRGPWPGHCRTTPEGLDESSGFVQAGFQLHAALIFSSKHRYFTTGRRLYGKLILDKKAK